MESFEAMQIVLELRFVFFPLIVGRRKSVWGWKFWNHAKRFVLPFFYARWHVRRRAGVWSIEVVESMAKIVEFSFVLVPMHVGRPIGVKGVECGRIQARYFVASIILCSMACQAVNRRLECWNRTKPSQLFSSFTLSFAMMRISRNDASQATETWTLGGY